MKHILLATSLLASSLLVGCEMLPQQASGDVDPNASCLDVTPSLQDSDCMLEAWVDFGLAAQRGDAEWRETTLMLTEGDSKSDRLARAVVYAWSDQSHWEEASELFKADLAAAPSRLQPLLRQWLNGLEARRELAQRLSRSESARRQVARERDELSQKLDALTEIEQSINLRNQTP